MAALSQPFAFAGSLQLAADPALPQDPIPFNFSSAFVSLASGVLNITGAGTTTVPFDGCPAAGAKGVLLRYDPGQVGALAATLSLNASITPIELTPGSMLLYFDGTPVAGITSASITTTGACQIRFWVLG